MKALASCREWLKQDVYRSWLLVTSFIIAYIFGQGIPLWDDDFTSWFSRIKDKSVLHTVFEILSPVSTQPQFWGFNERPLQALVYQICHWISGYESWSYFLYKSMIYAGMGVMIYLWGLRLVPRTRNGKFAALSAAVFFLVAPGPMAAHILHQDFATTAEFLFLLLTYFIWREVEKTPRGWSSFPEVRDSRQRRWMARWLVLSLLTYVSYKSKADLKLIPGILAIYILLVRRNQWRLFAWPLALMSFLAVPWGRAIFQKLPPFLPGSKGSEIGWMWQPANVGRLTDFLWSSGRYDWMAALRESTLSLSGLLGPYLLLGIISFLVWSADFPRATPTNAKSMRQKRAMTFVFIWCGAILVAVSALPAINYTFRIRYGILTMVPTSLLLSWVFGVFSKSTNRLPKWAICTGLALFFIQTGINLNRSIGYRRDIGQVMVSVDQVYEYFAKTSPNAKLTLFPDFRPYDYRPEGPDSILHRESLRQPEDLTKNHTPYETYAISWNPSLWPQVEMVGRFSGCRKTALFDRIFPCPAGTGAFLMRYIGEDPLYDQGEAMRRRGDVIAARKLHEEFVSKHPESLAGLFVVGLEAYRMGDWNRAVQVYARLESDMPKHSAILYNHALALSELRDYKRAIERLKFVYERDPQNQAVAAHLYQNYLHSGESKRAQEILVSGTKKPASRF